MIEKLQITSKKYTGNTEIVSTRLPKSLVEKINDLAKDKGRSRSDIIERCLIFALDNLEEGNQDEK